MLGHLQMGLVGNLVSFMRKMSIDVQENFTLMCVWPQVGERLIFGEDGFSISSDLVNDGFRWILRLCWNYKSKWACL